MAMCAAQNTFVRIIRRESNGLLICLLSLIQLIIIDVYVSKVDVSLNEGWICGCKVLVFALSYLIEGLFDRELVLLIHL